jgi:hypothetical protein
MDPAIERLVYHVRKEVYRDLEKGKVIMPRGWFFVQGRLGPTEIMIPFVERFFDSPQTKDLLSTYVAKKWGEYKGKGNYGLLAVVLMSEQWFVQRERHGMTTEEAIAKYQKAGAPSDQKDRRESVTFMVFMADSKRLFMFEYTRDKGRVKWGVQMDDIEMADFGRFKDMYPKQVENSTHG